MKFLFSLFPGLECQGAAPGTPGGGGEEPWPVEYAIETWFRWTIAILLYLADQASLIKGYIYWIQSCSSYVNGIPIK